MFLKHYAPNCILPLAWGSLYDTFISLKFLFLVKLLGCLCFDLDPETECMHFAEKFEWSKLKIIIIIIRNSVKI